MWAGPEHDHRRRHLLSLKVTDDLVSALDAEAKGHERRSNRQGGQLSPVVS